MELLLLFSISNNIISQAEEGRLELSSDQCCDASCRAENCTEHIAMCVTSYYFLSHSCHIDLGHLADAFIQRDLQCTPHETYNTFTH